MQYMKFFQKISKHPFTIMVCVGMSIGIGISTIHVVPPDHIGFTHRHGELSKTYNNPGIMFVHPLDHTLDLRDGYTNIDKEYDFLSLSSTNKAKSIFDTEFYTDKCVIKFSVDYKIRKDKIRDVYLKYDGHIEEKLIIPMIKAQLENYKNEEIFKYKKFDSDYKSLPYDMTENILKLLKENEYLKEEGVYIQEILIWHKTDRYTKTIWTL